MGLEAPPDARKDCDIDLPASVFEALQNDWLVLWVPYGDISRSFKKKVVNSLRGNVWLGLGQKEKADLRRGVGCVQRRAEQGLLRLRPAQGAAHLVGVAGQREPVPGVHRRVQLMAPPVAHRRHGGPSLRLRVDAGQRQSPHPHRWP